MADPISKSAIRQAVDIAGGQTSLATKIGVSQGLVWQWCNEARISTRHFKAITAATGITAEQLLADELAKDVRSAKDRARSRSQRRSGEISLTPQEPVTGAAAAPAAQVS